MSAASENSKQNGEEIFVSPEAALFLKEAYFSANLIMVFFILNTLCQMCFKFNGITFSAYFLVLIEVFIIAYSFFFKFPFALVRVLAAFCAGFFFYQFFNKGMIFSASMHFIYWLFLALLTIRIPRICSLFVFSISNVFMITPLLSF